MLVQLCWLVWVNARRVGPRFGQVEPNEEGVREECAFFSPMSICTHSVCLDLCLWHRPEVRFPARVPLDAVSDTDPFRLPQVSAVKA